MYEKDASLRPLGGGASLQITWCREAQGLWGTLLGF